MAQLAAAAFRTTDELVQAILGDSWDGTTELTPFIDGAEDVVLNVCNDPDYTTVTQELIERWLAAHAYLVMNRRLLSEKTGLASGTYEGNKNNQNGGALEDTSYGRHAMLLDRSGGLIRLNASMKTGKMAKKIQAISMGGRRDQSAFFPFWWNWTQ